MNEILDKFIEEINQLKKYKKEIEYLKANKKKMADTIFSYELKEFENTKYEDRVSKHIEDWCKNCRWYCGENRECKWLEGTPRNRLDKDVLKPIKNEQDYFPRHKICGDFW